MTHSSIVEAVLGQADLGPGREAFSFATRSAIGPAMTRAELATRARRVAGGLRAAGVVRGDRVLVCLPTGEELVTTIFGVLFAGAACVPIYPPLAGHGLPRWKEVVRTIARIAQPRGAICAPSELNHMRAALAELRSEPFTLVASQLGSATKAEPCPVGPDDLAFVQFTSGTTRQPRGVSVSHGALRANMAALARALDLTAEDRAVSWLPPYHDMGLVGHVLTPAAYGVHQFLMPPSHFLVRPARWLRLLSDVRATVTTAPNSAYSMCVHRVAADARRDLHLRSLRWALNGAEQVQHETMVAFAEAYAASGLDPEALRPVYGLAETTLAATFSKAGGARFDWVNRAELAASAEARPEPAGTPAAQPYACVGAPIDGHELRVVNAAGGDCPERRVGEIWFRGPSVMTGYFNDPTSTREALRGGWLRTGDLGYLAAGELHVTGRAKELVIKAGRNYAPSDLESACADEPALRRGRVVAFGLPNRNSGTEDVVIVAEVHDARRVGDTLLARRIAAAVAERAGVRPDRVHLVEPGSLPKTTSGKLQRAKARAAYESGVGLRPARSTLPAQLAERARSVVERAADRARRLLGWK